MATPYSCPGRESGLPGHGSHVRSDPVLSSCPDLSSKLRPHSQPLCCGAATPEMAHAGAHPLSLPTAASQSEPGLGCRQMRHKRESSAGFQEQASSQLQKNFWKPSISFPDKTGLVPHDGWQLIQKVGGFKTANAGGLLYFLQLAARSSLKYTALVHSSS